MPRKAPSTVRRKKKVNIFAELYEALKEAQAYQRGEPVNLRVTVYPAQPDQTAANKKAATTRKRTARAKRSSPRD